MKALIVILVIVCFVYGARYLVSYYGGFKEKESPQTQTASTAMRGEDLPGLPSTFETSNLINTLLRPVFDFFDSFE